MKINSILLTAAVSLAAAGTAPAQTILAGGKSFRVHESPSIALSADQGKTWTLVYEGARKGQDNPSWVTGLASGAGKVVAVTNYGLVLTSADKGKTWTAQDVKTPLRLNSGFNGVAYGNGLFVAAGQQDALAYSADGVSWKRLGTDNLAPGVAGNPAASQATSQVKQTAKNKLGGLGSRLGGLGGGLVGNVASVAQSKGAAPDAKMSVYHTNTDPRDETKYTHTYGVDFIGGKFYLTGNFGRVAVFTVENGKPKFQEASHVHDKLTSALRETVSDGKGHLVAFSEAEMKSAASADGGQTWEEDFDLKPQLRGGAYGAGKFVGVSAFGDVATSADGKTWQVNKFTSLNDGGSLAAAAYAGKNWVLCGEDNSAWYSTDQGKTWQRADAKGLSLKRLLVL
jgi:photosystem II stability/assembly factor-like uncharacterized protein